MSVKKRTVKAVSLKDWINEVSVLEVARLLKVEDATVRHWRRGHALPRADHMQKINRLSRGTVSYEEMIETHLKKQSRK